MCHHILETLYYHGLCLKCYGLVSTVSCIFWTICLPSLQVSIIGANTAIPDRYCPVVENSFFFKFNWVGASLSVHLRTLFPESWLFCVTRQWTKARNLEIWSVIQNRENLLQFYIDVASRNFNTLFRILHVYYAVEKVPVSNHNREIFFFVINAVSMVLTNCCFSTTHYTLLWCTSFILILPLLWIKT